MNWLPQLINRLLMLVIEWLIKKQQLLTFNWPGTESVLAPSPSPVVRDIEARLPAQPALVGRLDPNSPTWAFVKTWAEDMLSKKRTRNDSMVLDEVQTAALRGDIRMLKAIIALPEPKTKGLLNTEDDEEN